MIKGIYIALTLLTLQTAITDKKQLLFEQVEIIADRLNLSEIQKEQATPILIAALQKGSEALARYGIDLNEDAGKRNLSVRAKIGLAKEMRAVQQNAHQKLAVVLTEDQLIEYKQIQEERRRKVRNKLN